MSENKTVDSGQKGAFSRAMVMWLAIVGGFAFAALMLLTAYSDDLRTGNDGRPHALSRSAVGYSGLVSLLNHVRPGFALVSRGPENAYDRGLTVVTLSPFQSLSEDMLERIEAPLLIVLPKWNAVLSNQTSPFIEEDRKLPAGHVWKVGALGDHTFNLYSPYDGETYELTVDADEDSYRSILGSSDNYIDHTNGWAAPSLSIQLDQDIENFVTLNEHEALMPIIVDDAGRTVLASINDSPVYVLSDPDLFNNFGLSDPKRAEFAVQILDALRFDDEIYFDVTTHGLGRSRNLFKLMFEPPFSAATLALLVATGLMAWRASVRFGAPQQPAPAFVTGKKALADNAAALVHLAGRAPRYASDYAQLTRRSASKALNVPRDMLAETRSEALNDWLDTMAASRSQNDIPKIETLQQEAREATTGAALMRVAQRLYAWRQEFKREP